MKTMFIAILSALMFVAAPMAASAHGAVSEMATIIMHLKHFPSADEKKVLAGIVADAKTTGDKVIAGALMRMQHHVEGADADALRKLAADDDAPAAEKELAGILLGINHHPSDSDILRLKAIAK